MILCLISFFEAGGGGQRNGAEQNKLAESLVQFHTIRLFKSYFELGRCIATETQIRIMHDAGCVSIKNSCALAAWAGGGFDGGRTFRAFGAAIPSLQWLPLRKNPSGNRGWKAPRLRRGEI
jgi:hypothetical protein